MTPGFSRVEPNECTDSADRSQQLKKFQGRLADIGVDVKHQKGILAISVNDSFVTQYIEIRSIMKELGWHWYVDRPY